MTGGPAGDGGVPLGRQGRVARRAVLGAGLALGVVGGGSLLRDAARAEETIPLVSAGVGFSGPSQRSFLLPQERFPVPGSRALTPAARTPELVAAETGLLAVVRRTVDPRWAGLAGDAVLDLNVLSAGLPAPVAAWTANWRYVWPRDAAHVCRLYADLGRGADVLRWITFLARCQRPDGQFEARYTLAGSTPDARPHQADGAGWFLWALHRSCRALPGLREDLLAVARPAAVAALRAVFTDLDRPRGDGLPSPTPDYWEVPERRTTLGVAAVTLAGLQAAAALGEDLGPQAVQAASYAERLREVVAVRFGRTGFRRYARGGGYDAALALLLPPYVHGLEREVVPLLDLAWTAMLRPAGGVSPGEGWKDTWVSWTPETALFAQAYVAAGHPGRGRDVLAWLEEHRTVAGSLPEKVLSEGSPAAVAPLAWTCALVCSTAMELAPPAARGQAEAG
ncbi:glycoside hydrolase family 15 protein [Ornithinimicrobium avium]|uniref:Glycoside hydrolase family 15 n=1 Tax=Ornithinimicrobium avium TaxID=2283195 RepID=A0A345NPP2_9MICO|nr:glycoside hydrolase family 15 [Ornithinimicrobium avium]AXH97000.1 glycoside hydrolase family 15 [Ornithinimicrobium avium]